MMAKTLRDSHYCFESERLKCVLESWKPGGLMKKLEKNSVIVNRTISENLELHISYRFCDNLYGDDVFL